VSTLSAEVLLYQWRLHTPHVYRMHSVRAARQGGHLGSGDAANPCQW
jgi:hypothetical protein